jgi:hypothetical protein
VAHSRLSFLALAVVAGLAACSPAPTAKPAPLVPTPPPLAFEDAPVAKFHSIRFALNLPLVDGKSWKIDDHSTRELVALHPGSSSAVHVALWPEQELMNRAKCELRANELGYMPDLELEPVDQEVTSIPAGWDSRVLVATEVPKSATARPAKLVGHVFAFASFIRKCIFFHFETAVAIGDTGANAAATTLSSRLAAVRLKTLEGLTLDTFAAVPREKLP